MNPKVDYSAWRFWFDIGQYVIAVFIAFYIWVSNRDKVRSRDIKAVRKATFSDIRDVETRITKLESGTISHEDLGKVYDRINEVSDQMSNMSGTMNGIKGAVDMIQDHLLNKGK